MNPKAANKNRFVSAFLTLYNKYREIRDTSKKEFQTIIDEYDNLSEQSKRVMTKLFEVIDSKNILLTDNEIRMMTMAQAQKILLEAEKHKSKDKIMEQVQENKDAIYVNRSRTNPDIVIATGERLKNITGFLKKELNGTFNKDTKEWELNVSQTVDARKLFGLIQNKAVNAEVMEKAKEDYKADPSEKNYLQYGVATAIYSEKINYPWAVHSLEIAKEDPKKAGLVTSLEAMIHATDKLKELGFMKDEMRKVETAEQGEIEVPYTVFISRDAQITVKANLANIDDDNFMKSKLEELLTKTNVAENKDVAQDTATLPQKHNRRS